LDHTEANVQILSDGSWFCGDCHSLNRAGSPRCYSCRLSLPGQSKSANQSNGLLALLGLALVLVLTVGVGFAFTSKSNPAPSDAPVSRVAAVPTDVPTEILLTDAPTLTVTPTAVSTEAPTATPTVAPTATPTVAPTAAPTAKPTAKPTPKVVTPTAKPPSNGPPTIPVSIPGVNISYYNISGADGNTLLNAMIAQGAAACQLSDAAACFYDSFKWTYTGDTTDGVCKVTKVNFTATYNMILPHWTGPSPVPQALISWWKTVFNHIVWHESQHLAIARTYAQKYQDTILAGPCDQAGQNNLTRPIGAQLQAAQAAFDVQDHNNWVWPPYNG
jgi:predicted secreted Zn-dependent protease